MKAKNQRLVLLGLAIAAVAGAALLAMSAMRDQASFFYAPADVARQGRPMDRAVRIGGMVRRGSIRHHPDGVTIDFLVGDETPATIPVTYRGITPGPVPRGQRRHRRGPLPARRQLRRRRDPRQA